MTRVKGRLLAGITTSLLLWASPAIPASPVMLACGGVDDTSAVNSAVASAISAGVPLQVTAETCKYSTTIDLTKLLPIWGLGRGVSWLEYCGSGDAIKVEPTSTDWQNENIRDLGVIPCTASGGTHGIEVLLASGAHFAYSNFTKLFIGNFGGTGLWLNNTANNLDGIFNVNVDDSLILNGITGTLLGDSVGFHNDVITGKNNVTISAIASARMIQIIGGQITTQDGQLVLSGVSGARVERVWMERPGAPTIAYASNVLISGGVDNQFIGNQFSAFTGSPNPYGYNVAMVGASGTKLINNAFDDLGTLIAVYGTSTTVNTTVSGNYGITSANVYLQGS